MSDIDKIKKLRQSTGAVLKIELSIERINGD